ncbi:MAG: hypothetical protein SAJ12_22805 [Jaaginema sp. PMC 1079.18]|nr:hypothetical protein [Jaaginema sp. PMC 1080.18]MEC4853821.1 hypothetical protein [Jaaginema sp. PMC 1079.18]MEC4865354.1 hypothetical protein [Jaaginema sp. PMC 1078.18]
MFRRLWQWLKRFWGKIFGQSSLTPKNTTSTNPEPTVLRDADYEFLYMQLLEGVAHGWQADRIDRFFTQLGDRGKVANWLDWLERFGDRLVATQTPQPQLTTRMILLAQQIEQLPKRRELGRKSNAIVQNLQKSSQKQYPIWEYDGPDSVTANPPQSITLDELLERLRTDRQWSQYIAQQFGLDVNSDPEIIVQAFINNAQQEIQRRQSEE